MFEFQPGSFRAGQNPGECGSRAPQRGVRDGKVGHFTFRGEVHPFGGIVGQLVWEDPPSLASSYPETHIPRDPTVRFGSNLRRSHDLNVLQPSQVFVEHEKNKSAHVRYSGHPVSRLELHGPNLDKQSSFPTIRRNRS